MGAKVLTRASSPTGAPKTFTAFCTSRPQSQEVKGVLQELGFHLVFFLPADETNASMSDYMPPLPAQYHFEDEVGTSVVYLAGIDMPCLADDEDDTEERITYRYPPHASRFWLTPGGHELVARRVRETLTVTWKLCWLDLCEGQFVENAA